MAETSGDRTRTRGPVDGASPVSSEPLSVPFSRIGRDVREGAVGDDIVASLREDAHRLAARCAGVERLFLDGSNGPSDTNDTRDLLAAARDVECACQQLLATLGGELPTGSPLDATRTRVLVVDDLPDATEIVAEILENAGFEVVTATNGLEGLLAAHRSRPTVILMDVQMPVLDGIQATRLLKAAAATRDIPVIAHTARPDTCHVPPGRLFAHVLPKPVSPDILLALVQQYVRD